MQSVYDMFWSSVSFPKKLYLVIQGYRNVFNVLDTDFEGYTNELSALSSTLYSVAGTAKSKFSWKPWTWAWLPLGAFCYWRLFTVSDQMNHFAQEHGVDLSASQLLVRGEILMKDPERINEAYNSFDMALRLCSEPGVDRALLLVKMAEVIPRVLPDPPSEISGRVREMLSEAVDIIRPFMEFDPGQTVRVWRATARIHDMLGERDEAFHTLVEAYTLAHNRGLTDQVAKTEGDFRDLGFTVPSTS